MGAWLLFAVRDVVKHQKGYQKSSSAQSSCFGLSSAFTNVSRLIGFNAYRTKKDLSP